MALNFEIISEMHEELEDFSPTEDVQVTKTKNMSRRGKELGYDIIEKFDDFESLYTYLNEHTEWGYSFKNHFKNHLVISVKPKPIPKQVNLLN